MRWDSDTIEDVLKVVFVKINLERAGCFIDDPKSLIERVNSDLRYLNWLVLIYHKQEEVNPYKILYSCLVCPLGEGRDPEFWRREVIGYGRRQED